VSQVLVGARPPDEFARIIDTLMRAPARPWWERLFTS